MHVFSMAQHLLHANGNSIQFNAINIIIYKNIHTFIIIEWNFNFKVLHLSFGKNFVLLLSVQIIFVCSGIINKLRVSLQNVETLQIPCKI